LRRFRKTDSVEAEVTSGGSFYSYLSWRQAPINRCVCPSAPCSHLHLIMRTTLLGSWRQAPFIRRPTAELHHTATSPGCRTLPPPGHIPPGHFSSRTVSPSGIFPSQTGKRRGGRGNVLGVVNFGKRKLSGGKLSRRNMSRGNVRLPLSRASEFCTDYIVFGIRVVNSSVMLYSMP